MQKRESECVHKNISKEKDTNNESEYEETTVVYDPVIKDPRDFNIFKCGNNLLNKIDVTY